jgi:hypothetical protein
VSQVRLDSATQESATVSDVVYNPTTGAVTGTNAFSIVESIAAQPALPRTGAFALTVTAAAVGAATAPVGSKFYAFVTSPGVITLNGPGSVTSGLVTNDSAGWYAQSSEWNSTANAVATDRFEWTATFGTGRFLSKTGSTTTLDVALSTTPLTLPSSISGGKYGRQFVGNVPGYASFSDYNISALHPPGSVISSIAIDAAAGAIIIGSYTYLINSVDVQVSGNFEIDAHRHRQVHW